MATLTIQPAEASAKDTIVDEYAPTTAYGTDTALRAGYRPAVSKSARSLVQFDLSGIPTGATITSAVFSVYMTTTNESLTGTVEFAVNRVTADWDEAAVTWNTKPAFDATPSATLDVTGGDAGWKAFTITTLVSAWFAGTYSNYGLYLKQTNETGIANSHSDNYHSSGGTESLRPKLVVEYTPKFVPKVIFVD